MSMLQVKWNENSFPADTVKSTSETWSRGNRPRQSQKPVVEQTSVIGMFFFCTCVFCRFKFENENYFSAFEKEVEISRKICKKV